MLSDKLSKHNFIEIYSNWNWQIEVEFQTSLEKRIRIETLTDWDQAYLGYLFPDPSESATHSHSKQCEQGENMETKLEHKSYQIMISLNQ